MLYNGRYGCWLLAAHYSALDITIDPAHRTNTMNPEQQDIIKSAKSIIESYDKECTQTDGDPCTPALVDKIEALRHALDVAGH